MFYIMLDDMCAKFQNPFRICTLKCLIGYIKVRCQYSTRGIPHLYRRKGQCVLHTGLDILALLLTEDFTDIGEKLNGFYAQELKYQHIPTRDSHRCRRKGNPTKANKHKMLTQRSFIVGPPS